LPPERWAGTDGFVQAETLLGFREWLTFASETPDDIPPMDVVIWQSLRVYAPEVSQATALRDKLDQLGFETRLMTDQVDRILKLETGLRQIFTIVLILSATAFVITTCLLQWLSVVRKKRDFALMSVIGMTATDRAVFPLVQGSLMTACACAIALLLAAAAQAPIETIVQGYLTTPTDIQTPDALPFALGAIVAITLGAVAGIGAALNLRLDDMSTALRGD
jgi:ABC-type lipoprotein release transport system permease subunit